MGHLVTWTQQEQTWLSENPALACYQDEREAWAQAVDAIGASASQMAGSEPDEVVASSSGTRTVQAMASLIDAYLQDSGEACEGAAAEGGDAVTRVPLGSWTTEIQDWKVRFTKVDRNAWPEIKRANMFNDPPAKDRAYVMAFIEFQYLGDGRDSFGPAYNIKAVGDSGVEYDGTECGVLPEPNFLDEPTLRHNGKARGWLCWNVERPDTKSLVAFLEYSDGSMIEFALK